MGKKIVRTAIAGLMCAFALLGPLQAAETAPSSASPTMQDMVNWRNGALSKYDSIIYQNEDATPIGEDVFFARVVNEKRGFDMQTNSAAPGQITIRLLNDAEQREAQAHIVR